MENKNKIPVWVFILIVIIAVCSLFYWYTVRNTQVPVTGVPTSATSIQTQHTESSSLPSGFPAGMPLEMDTQVIVNQTITNPVTGQHQAIRTYITNQTMSANMTAFKKYFTDAGWTITDNPTSTSTYGKISATKGSAVMNVQFDYSGDSTRHTVNLGYIY